MSQLSPRDIKKAAWKGIDGEFDRIVKGLKTGNDEALGKFLEYCVGKTSRWSLINIAKLYAEGIKNPVTDSQLSRLQHRMNPGARKTWIFMPVMIDEKGEVAPRESKMVPEEKPQRENADEVAKNGPTAEETGRWLEANPNKRPMLWEAFIKAVPTTEMPSRGAGEEKYAAWMSERSEKFSEWVGGRYGQDIQSWSATQPAQEKEPVEGEKPAAKLRLTYALSRVIVDLHTMTTGPEVPKPQVNPKRVLHLLSRYAKEEGVQLVGQGEGEGTANEVEIIQEAADNVKAISIVGGMVDRAFDLQFGEDDSERRQEQISAATYIVTNTLGIPAKFSVQDATVWGEDIKSFSETMRGSASVSQSVVRGVIATMNVIQAERETELKRQVNDEKAAEAQAAEESTEERALADSLSEPEEELVGMRVA